MIDRKPSTDIIRAVVEALTFPMRVLTVATVGTVHTLTVCELYHAQKGYSVTIGANTYTIDSVSYPNTLVLEGPVAPVPNDTFELYGVFFFHGTPIATGGEIKDTANAFAKTPMIWLMENYRDTNHDDSDDPFDREIRGRLFFLTQQINETQLTAEAYTNAIIPMMRLKDRFVQKLKQLKGRFLTDDLKTEGQHWAKFGVYITEKGVPKALFMDKLAGTEMQLNPLWVYKEPGCREC